MIPAGYAPMTGGSASSLPVRGFRSSIIQGDCIQVMKRMDAGSVDFVLTDPPYLCRYRSRTGQTIRNDENAAWVRPAFREIYRVLKSDALCLSFYGWNKTDVFFDAWQAAGFRIVGHIVFCKSYASSKRFVRYQHESAYLLAKGQPKLPDNPPADVVEWAYTGNRLHPTQKPVKIMRPFIEAYCPRGGVVLDPFCGSGSTLVAAKNCGCEFIGIDLEPRHCETAGLRLAG